ncbi:ATP-binding cassette domain-containing protein [Streptomyces sp. NPDC001744]|uniref:ATP-binding cassette domain-containing protein n=1 Tax=Streptomyces sp. NPDC001744 TaxID=3364606 RepID=UPI00367AED22
MDAETGRRPHGAAVVADGFGVKGPRGWAFREVSFRAEPGALVAIEGPSGSGRTCLLLALTGRMKATEGRAEVGGLPLPRKMAAVRRISALGQVFGVNELDPALTVAEHLRERALLQRRFDGSVRSLLRRPGTRAAEARTRIAEAVAGAGLDLDALPRGERTAVRDLERPAALRLSLALALIGRPRLLAVDDIDLKLSDADRAGTWALLRSLAASGTTVLAVCSESPADTLRVRTLPVPEGTPEKEEEKEEKEEDAAATAEEPEGPVEAAASPGTSPGAGPGDAKPGAAASGDTGSARPKTTAAGSAAAGNPADGETGTDRTETDTTASTTEEGAADALAETGRA